MALYRYKALSAAGETLDGQMEAANQDEVIVRLQDQGYLPVEARRADEATGCTQLVQQGAHRGSSTPAFPAHPRASADRHALCLFSRGC